MTLSKMYLVPTTDYNSDRLNPPPPPVNPRPSVKTKLVAKRGKTDKQHPYDKWVALRTILLEADSNESDLIHRFADFLRKVLP